MSYYKRLKNDLAGAASAGIISPEQAEQIWRRSYEGRLFSSFRAAHLIGAAAGLFIALGVILVVSHNWDKIGELAKLLAYLLLFAGAAEASLRLEHKPAAAAPLEILWFFMPVLGIGLYAQIFNLSGDPVKPYLAWAALSLPLALLSRRRAPALLCSALLLGTLFYGTVWLRDGMLSLKISHVNESGLPPAWHWALALLTLAAAAWTWPGKKLGLPLGAGAVWVFAMMTADTAVKVRSEALALLAAMSLAVLWLSYGAPREDGKGGLPLWVWTLAVYIMTFFWHHAPSQHRGYGAYDTTAGAALACLLFAAALITVLFKKQRLLPEGKTEDITAKVLLAASMLGAFLLFGAGEGAARGLAVMANLILAAYGAACMLSGARAADARLINRGVLVIGLTALTRFVDIFGGLLKSGVAFILTGLAFAALAYFVNRGRRALIESVKK